MHYLQSSSKFVLQSAMFVVVVLLDLGHICSRSLVTDMLFAVVMVNHTLQAAFVYSTTVKYYMLQRLQHLCCSASNRLVCFCRPEQMFSMTSKGASMTFLSMLPSPTSFSWLGTTTSHKQWTTRLHRRPRTKYRISDSATSSCSRCGAALKCLVILHVCTVTPLHSSTRWLG